MIKYKTTIALAALLAGAFAPVASATETVFQEGVSPTGSYNMGATYIRSSQGGTNQNGDPDNEVLVGQTSSTDIFRGLFEFNLSAIGSGQQVNSASLKLTTRTGGGGQGGTVQYDLHAYGFDIEETTATWNQPDVGGSDVAGGTPGALLASATFDANTQGLVVNYADSPAFQTAVQDALDGDGVLRLMVKKSSEVFGGSNEFVRFSADSFGTAGFRPELTIDHSIASEEPVITELSPPDNTGNVYVGQTLTATFDEDIKLVPGGAIFLTNLDTTAVTMIAATDSTQATTSGNLLIIDPSSNLAPGTTYAITIGQGNTISDLATTANFWSDTTFDTSSWNITTAPFDGAGPMVSSTDPADGSTEVSPTAVLTATFDKTIVAGSGNIVLKEVGGSAFATIAVTDATQVTVWGSTLSITPGSQLPPATSVAVQLEAGVVRNLSDVGNAAINDETTWNFDTASTTIHTASGGAFNNDTWNTPGSWDINTVPVAALNAEIASGQTGSVQSTTPSYSGTLKLNPNSKLFLNGSDTTVWNALGGSSVWITTDAQLILRQTNTFTIPNDFVLNGDAKIWAGQSTSAHNDNRTFSGVISGSGKLFINTTNGQEVFFTNTNTFSGGFDAGGSVNSGAGLLGSENKNEAVLVSAVNGLGTGDVLIDDGVALQIDAPGDAIADSAKLTLLGGDNSSVVSNKLVLNADDTVNEFEVYGFPRPAGTYGRIGTPASVNYEVDYISGNGVLTVGSSISDTGAPGLVGLGPVDGTGDVFVAQSFTLNFDEPVTMGSGLILFKNLTDSVTRPVDVTDSQQVSIVNETTVVINPSFNLDEGKDYAVQVPSGAILDLFGNAYGGITDDTSWNVTTASGAITLLAEDFESPDITVAQANAFTCNGGIHSRIVPSNGSWIRATSGYCGGTSGIDTELAGRFTDVTTIADSQAYAFRYSTPGLTTAEDVLGDVLLGATYKSQFDVVQDGADGAVGYNAGLIAFVEGATGRTNANGGLGVGTGNLGVGAAASGFGTTNGLYSTISVPDYNPVLGDALLGGDLTFRFEGNFNSGLVDNVLVTVEPEAIAPTVASITDSTWPSSAFVGSPVTFTVTFSEYMDGATVDIGDFGNAGTAGITVVSVTPVGGSDYAQAYQVVVNTTSPGTLQLQVEPFVNLEDAAEDNPLDTSSAIPAGNIITIASPPGGSAFDLWAGANGVPAGSEAIDSDLGGKNNLFEFALGGTPTDGNDDGALLHHFVADGDADTDADSVLTILVRDAAVTAGFAASGNDQTATADGVIYTVAGGTTLPVTGDVVVNVAPTTVTTNLPAAPSGYTYVSFILADSVSEGLGEGYYQVTVSPAP